MQKPNQMQIDCDTQVKPLDLPTHLVYDLYFESAMGDSEVRLGELLSE